VPGAPQRGNVPTLSRPSDRRTCSEGERMWGWCAPGGGFGRNVCTVGDWPGTTGDQFIKGPHAREGGWNHDRAPPRAIGTATVCENCPDRIRRGGLAQETPDWFDFDEGALKVTGVCPSGRPARARLRGSMWPPAPPGDVSHHRTAFPTLARRKLLRRDFRSREELLDGDARNERHLKHAGRASG